MITGCRSFRLKAIWYHFRTFSDFILLCLIFYFNDADSLVIVFISTVISVLQMYFKSVIVLSIRKCTLFYSMQIIFIYKLHNFSNLAHKLNLRKTLDIIKMNISWFTFQPLYHFSIFRYQFNIIENIMERNTSKKYY